MKKNKLVSIIIPCYNVESYLDRCIKSLLNQSYKDLEILLIDDGSKDGTGALCDKYAKKYSIVKAYHKKNSGAGNTRNYGIQKATGDFIVFLDSDDYIEKDTIESLMKYSNEYDIVCCGFDRIDPKTNKIFAKEMVNLPYDELEINDDTIMETSFVSPACWGKLYRKELLNNIRFTSNTIEDVLFFTELMPCIKKIKFIKKVLWHYTVNDNSLILSVKEDTVNAFESDLLELKNKYIKNNYSKNYLKYLTFQVIIHNCISLPSRLYNNKKVNINKRIKHIKEYMNENFPDWKKIKIKIKGRIIKKLAIYTIIFMYKINIFKLFLMLYNFMINKLKIDVKW
jgi:glycosyltransferase involved in cell wall biosynthesis